MPRLRPPARPRADTGGVPPRRRALRRAPRGARRPAAARLPGAGVLDHPRHAVGLRGPRRARLPLRLQPVRLAAHPTADQPRAVRARTGSSCRPDAEIWEFPVTVWRVRGRAIPIGGGAYWRVLPATVLRRALREVAEPRTPTLCCTSIRTSSTRSRCGWRCRRARLRGSGCSRPGRASSATPAGGWSRIGFVRSPRSTRSSSYEEAHGEVVEHYGARQRSLSRAGVLV